MRPYKMKLKSKRRKWKKIHTLAKMNKENKFQILKNMKNLD